MAITKTTVYRMPHRNVTLDGSITREKRHAFDMLQDIDISTQLRALVFDRDTPFQYFKDAVAFNYGKNKLALGIELEIDPSTLDETYFEAICNALFESASTSRSISLRTKSGYVTTAVNAYAFACFYIYMDSILRTVERSSYTDQKYLASLYIKVKDSMYELVARSLDKEKALFVGSTVTVFAAADDSTPDTEERTIYVIEDLASSFSDAEIKTKFNKL